jgi:hypothetical protein
MESSRGCASSTDLRIIEGRDVLVSKILSTRVPAASVSDMLNTQTVKLKSIACSTKPAARGGYVGRVCHSNVEFTWLGTG